MPWTLKMISYIIAAAASMPRYPFWPCWKANVVQGWPLGPVIRPDVEDGQVC